MAQVSHGKESAYTVNAPMLDANRILRLHDTANAEWHSTAATAPQEEAAIEALVIAQHRANFDLWHREDAARDPHADDSVIVQAKRDIDRLNQQRNDLVERIDLSLLAEVPASSEAVPLHSETPGLIIDRLSILSLKIFHTEEETRRPGAAAEHHAQNRERLAVLQSQRSDLALCLNQLWRDIEDGHRRFKLYRQLKMYNDPELNPVLYANAS